MCMFVTVFDACKSNPCQHNGRCDNTTGGFRCRCNEQHTGRTCSGSVIIIIIIIINIIIIIITSSSIILIIIIIIIIII